MEEVRYDEDGNPVTSNLADYAMISATELPDLRAHGRWPHPTPVNDARGQGHRRVGDDRLDAPAVQSAVVDALAHLGVRHVDMPASSPSGCGRPCPQPAQASPLTDRSGRSCPRGQSRQRGTHTTMDVTITVNGRVAPATSIEPRLLLVHYLRETVLELTGTNIGCDTSSCGACTVHVRGRVGQVLHHALAVQADGGAGHDHRGPGRRCRRWHPMQEAFQGATTGCSAGICTPGMVMAAVSLLEEHPDPTEAEVREGLEGNLCRCTGYHNIVKAVLAAARTPAVSGVAAGVGGVVVIPARPSTTCGRPRAWSEAISLLWRDNGDDAKLMAGGHSLLPADEAAPRRSVGRHRHRSAARPVSYHPRRPVTIWSIGALTRHHGGRDHR